jgi:hypothetical protein
MSLFRSPQEHAANPPESWTVVKAANRRWRLIAGTDHNGNDIVLHSADTRQECEHKKTSGFYFDLYQTESRWYAGESVAGWRDHIKENQ